MAWWDLGEERLEFGGKHGAYPKMKRKKSINWINGILCAAMLLSAAAFSGCQVSLAGQTLPSPYYFQDDIQYFRKGPEFKLSREAAALKAASAEAAMRNQ